MKNIGIQLIGFCGTLLFFSSYQCKDNKKLFRVQFYSYLVYTLHLILLGAVTGGVSYIINTLRSFCLGSKWKFAKSWEMCAALCLMQLAALALTWAGWISLLPVVANIAATIAGYTRNGRTIRLAGMFINSPLWMIYSLMSGSMAGVLDEVVTEVSMIVSIVRFGWKNLDKVEE